MERFELVDGKGIVQNFFEFEAVRPEYRPINDVNCAFFYVMTSENGKIEKKCVAGPIQVPNGWSIRFVQPEIIN